MNLRIKHIFIASIFVIGIGLASESRAGCFLAWFRTNLGVYKYNIAHNDFTVGRQYKAYESSFGAWNFTAHVKSLSEEDTVVDFGAGKARALLEADTQAKRVAFGFKRPKIDSKSDRDLIEKEKKLRADGKFQYREGLFLEIPDHEIPEYSVGTDYFGILSYAPELSANLQRMLDHLKIGGVLYVNLKSEVTSIRSGQFQFSIDTWLKGIDGLRVTDHAWGTGDSQIKIEKLEAGVRIPVLKTVKYDARSQTKLPFREYVQTNEFEPSTSSVQRAPIARKITSGDRPISWSGRYLYELENLARKRPKKYCAEFVELLNRTKLFQKEFSISTDIWRFEPGAKKCAQ